MAIKLTKQTEGSVLQPSAGKVQLFVDSADDSLKLKDENDVVIPVGSGGGLTRNPTVQTSNFTAVADTSYLVAASSLLTVSLPAAPVDGTKVEIIAITGNGGPLEIDPNGNSINILGSTLSFTLQFYAQNCHFVFEYSTADAGGRWTETQNGVNSYFGENGAPLAHALVYTDASGAAFGTSLGDDTFLGRHDADTIGIQPLSLPAFTGHRKALTSPYAVASGTLTNVSGLSFALDATGWHTFEFEVPLDISASTGAFTLAVNFDNTVTTFSAGAMIVSSSTVATHDSTNSNGSGMTGGSQGVGTFVSRISGSINVGALPGTLSFQIACTNTTDASILAGAWGVVHRANLYP